MFVEKIKGRKIYIYALPRALITLVSRLYCTKFHESNVRCISDVTVPWHNFVISFDVFARVCKGVRCDFYDYISQARKMFSSITMTSRRVCRYNRMLAIALAVLARPPSYV